MTWPQSRDCRFAFSRSLQGHVCAIVFNKLGKEENRHLRRKKKKPISSGRFLTAGGRPFTDRQNIALDKRGSREARLSAFPASRLPWSCHGGWSCIFIERYSYCPSSSTDFPERHGRSPGAASLFPFCLPRLRTPAAVGAAKG